jgi:L-lactate dehydrogenase
MGIKTRKVVIIGTGHVGSHCAFSLALQGVCDEIIMVDINESKANAHAIDLSDAVAYLPHHVKSRMGSLSDCKDADAIVLSAGVPPSSTKTRLDFLGGTLKIVDEILDPIIKSNFDGIFIVISNPVDVVAHYIWEKSGFPQNKIFGTGTTLDSARLRRILSDETGVDQKSIQAYSMGEHGDSQMIPWSHIYLGGKPLLELMKEKPESYGHLNLDELTNRTSNAAYNIIRGKGCTEFGIGAGLTEIVKTIFHDEKKILPASTLLQGQYKQNDVFASVPVIMGKDGIEEIVELNLTEEEQKKFSNSCLILKEYIQKAKTL